MRFPLGLCAEQCVSRLLIAVSLSIYSGCNSTPADYPELTEVTGIVNLDGQPLEGARVKFIPQEGRPAEGVTRADGAFELQYSGTHKGASLGPQKVQITKLVLDPAPADQGSPDVMINVLPAKYEGNNTELTADVKAGGNSFVFDLTSE